jgi:glycosyltransferase involved in cell wall biosynthesis
LLRCRRIPGISNVGIGFSLPKILMDISLVVSLIAISKKESYDVIHAIEEAIFPAVALRWWHRGTIIYDMDSHLVGQLRETRRIPNAVINLLEPLERWAIRRADRIVPVCQELADIARASSHHELVHVIEDASAEEGDDVAPQESLRSLVGEDVAIALYVGNLEAYQGLDLIVDALELVPEHVPVAVVAVGGEPQDVERYRAMTRSRGLNARMHFTGPRSLAQLMGLLRQADVLLSPRVSGKNTPLKIYSYMASRRPILATRLPTHTQVLTNETAELVQPEAPAFARGLCRLLTDPERAQQIAENAYQLAIREYSPQAFRRKLNDLYLSLNG